MRTKFDNSMLKSFRDCPSQYYWRYENNLVLSSSEKSALYFGDVWHKCLSSLWLNKWNLEKAIETADTLWVPARGDEKRTYTRLIEALAEYSSNEDYIQDYEESSFVADEIFASFPISVSASYCGNIDKALKKGDSYIILDHKTSSWNHVSDKAYELEPQFIGYTWLLSKFFGIPTSHISFCLDMLFLQGKQNKFYRRTLKYSDEIISRWEEETRTLIRLIQSSLEWHSPRCSDFGDCPYYWLCNETDSEALTILKETMYKEEIWNFKQEQKEGE